MGQQEVLRMPESKQNKNTRVLRIEEMLSCAIPAVINLKNVNKSRDEAKKIIVISS
jgi:hypothetical protein